MQGDHDDKNEFLDAILFKKIKYIKQHSLTALTQYKDASYLLTALILD